MPGEELTETARALFVEELANFCMEVIQPTGPVAKQQRPHVRYHGVRPSNNQQANDDRLMALGFCLQCEPLYRANRQLFVHIVQQPQQGSMAGAYGHFAAAATQGGWMSHAQQGQAVYAF